MARWGMVIDLARCVGCYACMIAYKEEHFLPPGVFWGRLLVTETGKYPRVRKVSIPVLCNHCEEAVCVKVCPTGASARRKDGVVTVDSHKCEGCRCCVVACPYQQRTYLREKNKEYFPAQGLTEFERIGQILYPHEARSVTKCNFCAERIDDGIRKGLKPGLDREATPACVNMCMVKARRFGDLGDPDDPVSVLIRERKAHPLRPELGSKPSVYYID